MRYLGVFEGSEGPNIHGHAYPDWPGLVKMAQNDQKRAILSLFGPFWSFWAILVILGQY
jgi:hypothetical protein